MAVSDSKCPKMDEPSGDHRSNTMIFNPRAEEFKEIIEMPAFIDHSSLIKKVWLGPPATLVVAPSRFCKSANLKMLQSFLEIEVETEGENKGNQVRDVTKPASSVDELEKLRNYQLFRKAKCKILDDEEFVKEHFGRYPIIYLDFGIREIDSYEDAVEHCKRVIHHAFECHQYLVNSTKLKEDKELNQHAQHFCRTWCSIESYKQKTKQEIKTGLQDLANCLHSHFGRKVVVLIDEYDAVMTSAMFRVSTNDLRGISNLVTDAIGFSLKGGYAEEHTEKVFLTGISSLSSLGVSSQFSRVVTYRFLEKEDIVPFYGVVESQLCELIRKLRLKKLLPKFEDWEEEKIVDKIKKYYTGYYSKECTCIFSLWSVLHFLQSGEAKSHWTKPEVMNHFCGLLNDHSFTAKLLQLVGKEVGMESIRIQFPDKLEVEELQALVTEHNSGMGYNVNLAFSFLMELGYLSNVENKKKSQGQEIKVKVANEEIRDELLDFLVHAKMNIAGFDLASIENCANTLNKLCVCKDSRESDECLMDFYETLKTFFGKGLASFESFDINESLLMCVMAVVFSKAKFKRLASDHWIKNEKGEKLTSDRPDVWMQQRKSRCIIIILEIEYNSFEHIPPENKEGRKYTSLHAMQEILGNEGQPKIKGYYQAMEKFESDDYLLVGLSVDGDFRPSICFVQKNKEIKHAVCASERKPGWFCDYYCDCSFCCGSTK